LGFFYALNKPLYVRYIYFYIALAKLSGSLFYFSLEFCYE
jgi:hypothetical protein